MKFKNLDYKKYIKRVNLKFKAFTRFMYFFIILIFFNN